jgi:hypothetical protein
MVMSRQRKDSNIQNVPESEMKFVDKTAQGWYSREGSNKVTFCESIGDIIEGKGETYPITEMRSSYTKYVLFQGTDGKSILAKSINEIA